MKTGEIYILDEIGGQYINAKSIIDQLKKFDEEKVDEIKVYINSPGGSVFEGLTIYNQLASRKNVTTIIEGLAASMASVIALAGKKVLIRPSSLMLVHNPWTIAIVDSEEVHKLGNDMDKIKNSITKIYVDKTGMKEDAVKSLMNENRFMDADEAVKKGFADEIVKPQDASNYTRSFVALGYGIKDDNQNKGTNTMLPKIFQAFLVLIGFTQDEIANHATDKDFYTKVDAKTAAKKAELKLPATATDDELIALLTKKEEAPPAQNSTDVADAIKALTSKVDQLQGDLNSGKATSAKQKAEELVDKAVSEFKILPTQKDTYVNAAIADYAKAEAELSKIPKNTVRPKRIVIPAGSDDKTVDMTNKESIQAGIRAITKEYADQGKTIDAAKALAILRKRNAQ